MRQNPDYLQKFDEKLGLATFCCANVIYVHKTLYCTETDKQTQFTNFEIQPIPTELATFCRILRRVEEETGERYSAVGYRAWNLS